MKLMWRALRAHALGVLLGLVLGGAFAQDPLEPEKAFSLEARALDARQVELHWKIADGHYLYRDKFELTPATNSTGLNEVDLPQGVAHEDQNFGRVSIFRNELRIQVRLSRIEDNEVATLRVSYQGCADGGVCYTPIRQKLIVDMRAIGREVLPIEDLEPITRSTGTSSPTRPRDEASQIAELIAGASFWVMLTTFFGLGLLLAFTPCVLPMVPILSGLIVNHGHAVTHKRAFVLSLSYVLGMALTYATAGAMAGLSGSMLSNALQNAWVLGGFSLMFVALAMSMFGLYQLQLPASLQAKFSETANRQGGSVGAIAMMGAISAMILGPCVAAPLAGALLYIAKTGDAWLGGAALFSLALGMGTPLLIVGVFSRSLLPKPGSWMKVINRIFGVLLLGTALWILSPVLSPALQMAGWAALLIIPSIYLHALDPLPQDASGWHRLWKGVGVTMLVSGVTVLLGLLGGARDPLQPLGFLQMASASSMEDKRTLVFEKVKTVEELDVRLRTSERPVLLDFYADWCVSCKEMERNTFADQQVRSRMQNFSLLKVDVTGNTEEDKALLKRYGLFGPPGILLFGEEGRERAELRVIGYQPPEKFLKILRQI